MVPLSSALTTPWRVRFLGFFSFHLKLHSLTFAQSALGDCAGVQQMGQSFIRRLPLVSAFAVLISFDLYRCLTPAASGSEYLALSTPNEPVSIKLHKSSSSSLGPSMSISTCEPVDWWQLNTGACTLPKSLGRFGSGEQPNSGLFDQSCNAIGLSAILFGGSQYITGVECRVLVVVKVVCGTACRVAAALGAGAALGAVLGDVAGSCKDCSRTAG